MASKKKKKGATILRCTNIALDKKSKKDFKSQTLVITYETASGSWSQKKIFDDVWKFVEATGKAHKKQLGKLIVNAAKYRDEAFKKDKPENAFKMMRDVINNIGGKNKKLFQSDSKIIAFIGAKRDHLNDIRTQQVLTKSASKSADHKKSSKSSKSSKSADNKTPSVGIGNNTFISDLGGGGEDIENKENEENINDKTENNNDKNNSNNYKQQIIEIKQEIDNLKRKHLSEISALKQENHNLKLNNATLKETNEASQEARQELEDKVIQYEQELGKNQIGDDIASIFADEFKKQEDPAEKYYQQTKKQQKRIDILEKHVSELSHENCDLKTKLERAKYVADHLATEVTELANPEYEQLEQDYKEVEAELDEMTIIKDEYEIKMAETAKILDQLELEAAKMRPHYEEYPNLVTKLEEQRKDNTEVHEKYSKLQEERDDFEDKLLDIQKKLKDLVSREEYTAMAKRYKQEIKELYEKERGIMEEKEEALELVEKFKQEMGEIKIKVGELEADNLQLEAGGGRDINLEISLDFENDFSIFKKDEFEYPHNLSRNQLILWCQHFKVLIKEINDELCLEINNLSKRNEILEDYIELKGLPFPEDDDDDDGNGMHMDYKVQVNDLPHPLPSMSFHDDLDSYNPTKKQLKDYIDLMFSEWKRDEIDSNRMVIAGMEEDKLLLNQLENYKSQAEEKEEEEEDNKGEQQQQERKASEKEERLKQQLEAAYLKQEEVTLELNKKIKGLKESNEQLIKQLRIQQQKNKVPKDESERSGSLAKEQQPDEKEKENEKENDNENGVEFGELEDEEEEEERLLRNRLNDTEEYIKELQDDMKQLEFETAQQKQALEREYKYQIELINIDLQESRNQCEDLSRQIGSDDLNELASEFRNELWDARADNNSLKKKHIEEIRQLERDRDELLREINLLRIKTDRMDQNSGQVVGKLQLELEKKEAEFQHIFAVNNNLSHIKEQMDEMRVERDSLQDEYGQLKERYEGEKSLYEQDIQQLNIEKKKLIIRIKTAEQDIKSLKQSAGIDSDAIITKTELVKIKQEMDDLRMKRADAVKSKIRLLQSSSLEIQRMRDEIRLLTGDRKISMRDFKPGRYDSTTYNNNNNNNGRYSASSLGSNMPMAGAAHQQILSSHDNNGGTYMDSAWSYTVGMLASIGSVFKGNDREESLHTHTHPHPRQYQHPSQYEYDDDAYDVHSDYQYDNTSRRSSISNGINNNNNNNSNNNNNNNNIYGNAYVEHERGLSHRSVSHGYHQKKPSRHRNKLHRYTTSDQPHQPHQPQPHNRYPSQASLYRENDVGHSRGLSSSALRAKKKKMRARQVRDRDRDNNKHMHRGKQPSKQEVLLDAEENDNMRAAMAKIFDAFEQAEDNVNRGSLDVGDISGVGGDELGLFSLDDMVNNDNIHDHDHDPHKEINQINQIDQLQSNIGHKRKSSSYHSDYMRKPLTETNEEEDNNNNNNNVMTDEYFDNILNNSAGVGDDNDNDNDFDDNIPYSDDDQFAIANMDYN